MNANNEYDLFSFDKFVLKLLVVADTSNESEAFFSSNCENMLHFNIKIVETLLECIHHNEWQSYKILLS